MQFPTKVWLPAVVVLVIIGTVMAINHFQTSDQQKLTSLEVQADNNSLVVINAQVCGVAAGDQSGVNNGQVLTALGAFEANKAITDVVREDLAYQFAISDGAIRLVGPPKPGVRGIVLCGR